MFVEFWAVEVFGNIVAVIVFDDGLSSRMAKTELSGIIDYVLVDEEVAVRN